MRSMKVPTPQLTSAADAAAGLAAGCLAASAAVENRQEAAAAADGAVSYWEVAERWTAALQGSRSHDVCHQTKPPADLTRPSVVPFPSGGWGDGLHEAMHITDPTIVPRTALLSIILILARKVCP
jgi:hypothetical protein